MAPTNKQYNTENWGEKNWNSVLVVYSYLWLDRAAHCYNIAYLLSSCSCCCWLPLHACLPCALLLLLLLLFQCSDAAYLPLVFASLFSWSIAYLFLFLSSLPLAEQVFSCVVVHHSLLFTYHWCVLCSTFRCYFLLVGIFYKAKTGAPKNEANYTDDRYNVMMLICDVWCVWCDVCVCVLTNNPLFGLPHNNNNNIYIGAGYIKKRMNQKSFIVL